MTVDQKESHLKKPSVSGAMDKRGSDYIARRRFGKPAGCASLSAMADEWIIRVAGKEYGPVDLATLHEWKAEGRVLPSNDVRHRDRGQWHSADQIPGLFQAQRVEFDTTAYKTTAVATRILPDTFAIFVRGFFKYLGLTLLVIGPSLCAEFAGALMQATPNVTADIRTLIAGAFALCMMLLSLALTPVYIAGIQILTAALTAGERIGFFPLLNEAVKFWPRVAFLWIFVSLCYLFWTAVPTVIILSIALSGPSFISIFLALVVLALQVWITGRLFINFMFWQQFAVLEGCDVVGSLRRSKELARSHRDLPWFRRPMWRGVFIASLWFVLVLALNWPAISQVFRVVFNATDPQAMVEGLRNSAKNAGAATSRFAPMLLQAILKPLLGIAFVLLFLESNTPPEED